MAEKAMLLDLSKCTGCRGCQVACKQWNKNPAEKTKFTGTYQNPPDLSAITWTLVRFDEVSKNGTVKWLFRKDQCRHCYEPACIDGCPVEGAITKKDGFAVVVNKDKCVGGNGCKFECKENCPYSIPKFDEKKKLDKCRFCIERIDQKEKPACAKTCPSGVMEFGNVGDIKRLARKRLAAARVSHPKASLFGVDDAHMIYLLTEKPGKYSRLEE